MKCGIKIAKNSITVVFLPVLGLLMNERLAKEKYVKPVDM